MKKLGLPFPNLDYSPRLGGAPLRGNRDNGYVLLILHKLPGVSIDVDFGLLVQFDIPVIEAERNEVFRVDSFFQFQQCIV
jgi:hypothetical protein